MNNDTVNDDLNNLLECLYDSQYGYQECAKEVDDISLKNLFEDLSKKRLAMIYDIKRVMLMPTESTTDSGSVTGVLHRTYINLKSLLTGGDKKSITAEVKRGEDFTLSQYEMTINSNLPSSAKDLLRQQLAEVKNDLAMIDAISNR